MWRSPATAGGQHQDHPPGKSDDLRIHARRREPGDEHRRPLDHVGTVEPRVEGRVGEDAPGGAIVREIPITNKRGLHARASAKFVQMVERFKADIQKGSFPGDDESYHVTEEIAAELLKDS